MGSNMKKIIGITGGIGSGKSTVLDLLEKNFSAYIIKADDVAKQLREPGGKAFIEVVDFFGEEILLPDGTIDRKKLAAVVFANPNKRVVLNSITHPLVKRKLWSRLHV